MEEKEEYELKDYVERPREIILKTWAMTDEEIISIYDFIHNSPYNIKLNCFVETWENEKRKIDLSSLKNKSNTRS